MSAALESFKVLRFSRIQRALVEWLHFSYYSEYVVFLSMIFILALVRRHSPRYGGLRIIWI